MNLMKFIVRQVGNNIKRQYLSQGFPTEKRYNAFLWMYHILIM